MAIFLHHMKVAEPKNNVIDHIMLEQFLEYFTFIKVMWFCLLFCLVCCLYHYFIVWVKGKRNFGHLLAHLLLNGGKENTLVL